MAPFLVTETGRAGVGRVWPSEGRYASVYPITFAKFSDLSLASDSLEGLLNLGSYLTQRLRSGGVSVELRLHL